MNIALITNNKHIQNAFLQAEEETCAMLQRLLLQKIKIQLVAIQYDQETTADIGSMQGRLSEWIQACNPKVLLPMDDVASGQETLPAWFGDAAWNKDGSIARRQAGVQEDKKSTTMFFAIQATKNIHEVISDITAQMNQMQRMPAF